MSEEAMVATVQQLTKKYGEDIAQQIALRLCEGTLPVHLIDKRAKMLAAIQARKDRRHIWASRHPKVQEYFYGSNDNG